MLIPIVLHVQAVVFYIILNALQVARQLATTSGIAQKIYVNHAIALVHNALLGVPAINVQLAARGDSSTNLHVYLPVLSLSLAIATTKHARVAIALATLAEEHYRQIVSAVQVQLVC